MELTISPYLSPPPEVFTFAEDAVAATIDPQKLTAPPAIPVKSECMSPTMTSSAATPTATIGQPEHDEDYGFSKFAAERDAARDEMDLDEDTRLLMSEEGKKLSPKERRQLRNKVSARNFRERRKEYIVHLESLVSQHQNEANQYKSQVETLKVENDELTSELSRLKISISAAIESNKLGQQSSHYAGTTSLTRSNSRGGTPSRETSLIPNMTKDINPYSANTNFNIDWPLSSMASPSNGSFDFSLHNYTSVFSTGPALPAPSFSEKELLGKDTMAEPSCQPDASECLVAFNNILSCILGTNWTTLCDDTWRSEVESKVQA